VTRNIVRALTATLVATSLSLASVVPLTKSTSSAEAAVAAATPKRHKAMRAAKTQKGKPYRYGGESPKSGFDCSGLVQWAYKKAGINLPRTTYSMQKSKKLKRTYKPRWGDIVFTSSGHVELYSHVKKGVRWMYGAHNSGTRVGYKKVYRGASGYPRYFRVVGAG
jgi:cell wall-associated NlpC family hydrolase